MTTFKVLMASGLVALTLSACGTSNEGLDRWSAETGVVTEKYIAETASYKSSGPMIKLDTKTTTFVWELQEAEWEACSVGDRIKRTTDGAVTCSGGAR